MDESLAGKHRQLPTSPAGLSGYWIVCRFISMLVLLCLPASSCQREALRPAALDSVGKIHRLSPAELLKGKPVALKGAVTYYDERSRLLMIQDESGGIAVEQGGPVSGLRQGDRVSIEGFTTFESFSPVIVKPVLNRLGNGPMPPAVPADPARLFTGGLDCQRVELECDVLSGRATGNNRFELDAALGTRIFRVSGTISKRTSFIQLLAHARIRLRGVPLTTYYPSGEIYSLTVYSSGQGDLEVLQGQVGNSGPPPIKGASESLPTLRTIGSIKALSNHDADRGYPVQIKGVVTNWDADLDWLILEDATGGIFVHPPEHGVPGLSFGASVEVDGTSLGGSFAPVVRPDAVRVLGRAPLPKPAHIHPSEGFTALDENRWTELEGIVREVSLDPFKGTKLILADGPSAFQVIFHTSAPVEDLGRLVDCRVRVRGVYAPIFSGDQRLVGFQLTTPDFRSLKVLKRAGGDTFDSGSRPIHSLLEYNPQGVPHHRVKVEGRVTHVGSDGSLYLADTSGGIRLERIASAHFRVGDSLQALGFLNWARANVFLQDVVIRPAAPLPEVPPLPIASEAALSGVHDAQLIEVEGFLQERTRSFGDRILSLESGRTKFTAVLEHPQDFPQWEQLRTGALVRLVGVCEIRWNEEFTPPNPESMRLLLRSPSDISILRRAPWWTLGRALALAAGLIAVLLVATGSLVVLQQRLRARTNQLRKQMQQQETLEEQLRQAQKLEGVGRLAGGVAHDFNNLLTVINGYCELLTMELPDGSELKACTLEIRKAAERAASLTKQLLAFSRKQILKPVVLDLNELVAEMDVMLCRLISEDVELITRKTAEACLIRVDPGQIGQVLMNLVVNARDAMPHGGQVIIETNRVALEARQLETHPDVLPGAYVQMTVTDTGLGMEEAVLKQIFEPFFTTKEPGKGTGLGLSTVFGIVKQSGGHIWVYSEPEIGTTFKLFFPMIEDLGIPEINLMEEITRGGGETVLVVEDQSDLRLLVRRALGDQGFRILTAESVQDALVIADKHDGPIHLLLTDVVMPVMNGKDLATRIKALRPEIRVLFMSGYTENVIVHKGVLEPGIAFIQKPFSTRELASRVRETLITPPRTPQ